MWGFRKPQRRASDDCQGLRMKMQSIITKYIAPSYLRGARLSVYATGGCRMMLAWRGDLTADENHREGARVFARTYSWWGSWIAGAYNDKGALIWVCISKLTADESFTVEAVL